MEFKQYPSYKKSGVEWLGDVPEHWESNRLKKYLIERNEKNSPIKTDYLLSVTMYQGVIPVSEKQGNGGNKPKENLENYKISYPNDIVLNSMNVIVGSVGLNKYTGLISPAYYALYNRNKNNNIKFFSYIFQNPFFQKGLFGLGNGIMYKESEDGKLNTIRLKIPMEKLNQVVLPCPSISEQNQIVAFLDTETARIDNLISKQEKLIELLEEQRKSIISHAVTKGLNPNAPMKDSGVEWLGDVPEHWDVKSYRFVSKIYRGKFGHRPRNDPSLYDGEYPFIQTGDVARAGKYIQAYSQTLNEKGKAVSQVFTSGTLVMAIAANIGDTAILNFEAYAPDSVVGFKPHKNIDLEFLRFSFIASLQALEQTAVQSTQANLNVERIGALKTTFPPLSEQIEISNYLNAENEKNNHLISKQNQLIEKLKEYRASIISHAVTGKIDVREFDA